MHDGGYCTYAGQDQAVPAGTMGQVLSCTAAYAHVQWPDGRVGLYPTDDLHPVEGRSQVTASLDDSLEVGSLESLAGIQEVYEETGGEGLVSRLASSGYLSVYSSVAEEAFDFVTGRLQQDPMLRQLVAAMDPEEADQVFRKVAASLLNESGDF